MKKKRVTYGVSGMMEYQAVIKIGRSSMKVLFTDGSMNAMGINPAKFTTDSLMVQHAIENSEQFKRKRIFIVSSVDLEEEVRIDHSVKPVQQPIPTPVPLPEPDKEEVKTDVQETTAQLSKKATEAIAEEAENAVPAEEQTEMSEAASGNGGLIEMEFDNNDDAKDFLEGKFGLMRSKLRNRADIISAGESHGISISFT